MRRTARNEAQCVQSLVQDREIHDLEAGPRGIRVVAGRPGSEGRSQIDRTDRARKTRWPGATAAMIVRPRAVVVDRVELAVRVESRRAQLALQGIAQIDSGRSQLRVRLGEPMERDVDL